MSRFRSVILGLSVVCLAGCYHATVDTGRRPSGQTVEDEWADSFIAGLVPPSTVETASRCPNGVAKVETKISFLNGLVDALTLGIYTPMTIIVQCADGSSDTPDATSTVKAPATDGAEAIRQAAELSAELGQPVLVELR